MPTVIICAVLLLLAVFAVRHYCKKLASGCCGAGGDQSRVQRTPVADRDLRHYPYSHTFAVEVMTCKNCAVRVENALNGIDGVYAQVHLGKKQAVVHTKRPLSAGVLRQAVAKAGYALRTDTSSGNKPPLAGQ